MDSPRASHSGGGGPESAVGRGKDGNERQPGARKIERDLSPLTERLALRPEGAKPECEKRRLSAPGLLWGSSPGHGDRLLQHEIQQGFRRHLYLLSSRRQLNGCSRTGAGRRADRGSLAAAGDCADHGADRRAGSHLVAVSFPRDLPLAVYELLTSA